MEFMKKTVTAIAPSEALAFDALIGSTEQGISSRVLAQTSGGGLTLFSFDEGQVISEHSAPFEALVIVLEGEIRLDIEGKPVTATPGHIVRMPPNAPHALESVVASKMLLVMLKEPKVDA